MCIPSPSTEGGVIALWIWKWETGRPKESRGAAGAILRKGVEAEADLDEVRGDTGHGAGAPVDVGAGGAAGRGAGLAVVEDADVGRGRRRDESREPKEAESKQDGSRCAHHANRRAWGGGISFVVQEGMAHT